MAKKKNTEVTIHSSAAEYLTYVAATGEAPESFEMRYENENIWLTQRMMAELYGVDVRTVNDHLKKVYADGELPEKATTLGPRRRGLRIVRDGVFFFKANAISHSLRRSSFPNRTRFAGLRFGFRFGFGLPQCTKKGPLQNEIFAAVPIVIFRYEG